MNVSYTCTHFLFIVQRKNLRFNFLLFFLFTVFSIMYYFVIVLFLSGTVAMTHILRTLHRDIIRYNHMHSSVSKNAHIWLSKYLSAYSVQFSKLYFFLQYSKWNYNTFLMYSNFTYYIESEIMELCRFLKCICKFIRKLFY